MKIPHISTKKMSNEYVKENILYGLLNKDFPSAQKVFVVVQNRVEINTWRKAAYGKLW